MIESHGMKKLVMDHPNLNEQILKAVFRKIGRSEAQRVALKEIRVGFELVNADTFFSIRSPI